MSSLSTLLPGPLLLTLVTAAGTPSPSYPKEPYPITDLVSYNGTCPEIESVGNFCWKNMEGSWFEYASYRDSEHIFKCNKNFFEFSNYENNGKMLGRRRREKLWAENNWDKTTWLTSLDKNATETIFNVSLEHFTWMPWNKTYSKVDLKIIYMDLNITILWGCRANPANQMTNQQSLLVLTREPNKDIQSSINGTVSSRGLDMEKLKIINQKDCLHVVYEYPLQVC